jgi:hypothetical protein
VHIPNGPTLHFREVVPKDFYLAQILRQSEKNQIELILRLLLNPEVLDEVTSTQFRQVIQWTGKTLLDQTILTVENWLEVAYHLCKQRWDSSIDWLEAQPMSKVQTMIEIVKKHAEEQDRAMKKNARKK